MRNLVRRLVAEELAKLDQQVPRNAPPVGYSPLAELRGAAFHWVPVPFNGEQVWMKLRTLNATQFEACGAVSLVEIAESKDKPTLTQIIEIRNKQEAIIAATMVEPTFDEMMSELTDNAQIRAMKKELAEIREQAKGITEPNQLAEIEARVQSHELFLAFLVPEDAFGFLTAWALGLDLTDIKKISREALLSAAILASNGHNNPSDHISGVFSDRDKTDIDKNAWIVFNQFQEMKRLEKKPEGLLFSDKD